MTHSLTEPVRPQDMHVPLEAIRLLTREQALRYCVCPVAISDPSQGTVTLTMASIDTNNLFLVDELQRITGRKVTLVSATEQDIMLGIAIYYLDASKSASREFTTGNDEIVKSIETAATPEEAAVLAEQPGAIRMVDGILSRSVTERATDIHIEPHDDATYVRFRIDGIMYDHQTYDPAIHNTIVSRIKILAGLDIAQNRLPQDGRFELTVGKRHYDVRTSVLPLLTGQKIVLRLLPKGHLSVSFNQLGMQGKNRETILEMIHKPYGMLLATGPTGSGKTSTMYACLSMIDSVAKNVITVEDPVEYQFARVGQMQVHPKIGLDFAAGLRAILRQDPDIIMVGEIRDLETLVMAVQSALTGHLVFSTLHCNDAAAGTARLVNMGAEPFLIASAVSGILSQRLVRKLCDKCKVQASVSRQIRRQLNLVDDDHVYYHGMGCQHCRNTGFHGRLSVFEVMPMTEAIQQAIITKAPASEIRHIMRSAGIPSMRDDGLEKARAGQTSLEEVLRAVYVDDI